MKISEAATGVGEEMADVGLAMQRAMDKTEGMRARAGAMEELEAAGAFDDNLTLTAGQDDIDRQLARAHLVQRGGRRPREAQARARPGQRPELPRSRRAPPRRRPALEEGKPAAAAAGGPAVIVRIATEDQYRLPDEDAARLNELDNEAVAAVDAGDEARFHALFEEMLALVRRDGHKLDDDDLEESDVIIPPPDLSFDEARHEFTGDGLIPD